jgi:hypothetical protein
MAIVSTLDEDGEFRAVQTPGVIDSKGRLRLPRDCYEALCAEPGAQAGYTPLPGEGAKDGPASEPARANGHAPAKAEPGRKPARPGAKRGG